MEMKKGDGKLGRFVVGDLFERRQRRPEPGIRVRLVQQQLAVRGALWAVRG